MKYCISRKIYKVREFKILVMAMGIGGIRSKYPCVYSDSRFIYSCCITYRYTSFICLNDVCHLTIVSSKESFSGFPRQGRGPGWHLPNETSTRATRNSGVDSVLPALLLYAQLSPSWVISESFDNWPSTVKSFVLASPWQQQVHQDFIRIEELVYNRRLDPTGIPIDSQPIFTCTNSCFFGAWRWRQIREKKH